MMTAGERTRERVMLMFVALFVAGLHWLGVEVLRPVLVEGKGLVSSKAALVLVAAIALLAFFMMLSQALESVTRAFYARSEMELILTSPAAAENAFAVRIWALTVTTASMSTMLIAPFINVATVIDQPGWLAAYAVMIALAMVATALAVWVMVALFAAIGAKRTRLVAQIVAAIVGASFLIGIQVAAILSANSLSRTSLLTDEDLLQSLPGADSWLWLPVNAAQGGPLSLALLLGAAVFSLWFTIHPTAPTFAARIIAATSLADQEKPAGPARAFRQRSPRRRCAPGSGSSSCATPGWCHSRSCRSSTCSRPPSCSGRTSPTRPG